MQRDDEISQSDAADIVRLAWGGRSLSPLPCAMYDEKNIPEKQFQVGLIAHGEFICVGYGATWVLALRHAGIFTFGGRVG